MPSLILALRSGDVDLGRILTVIAWRESEVIVDLVRSVAVLARVASTFWLRLDRLDFRHKVAQFLAFLQL